MKSVLVEQVKYEIEGDLDGVRCHILWHILDTMTTFWTRNMDWVPEPNTKYWYSKEDGFQLASELEA